jgi:hypothetical protein
MEVNEVARLIAYCYSLDARVGLGDEKVVAWSKALNQHMPYDLGIEFATKHYSNSKDVIMPADINLMFRNMKQQPIQVKGQQQIEGWKKATPEQAAYWAAKIRKDLAGFGNVDTSNNPVAGD